MIRSLLASAGTQVLHSGCIAALTSLLPLQEAARHQHSLWSRASASPTGTAAGAAAGALQAAGLERCQQRQRQGGRSSSSSSSSSRGFASGSKADDLDLIAVEVGIARIDGYDDTGFIVSDMQVEGPILCFGDLVTLWRVRSFAEVTEQSLALLDLLKPTPALLVLGCGRAIRQPPPELLAALRRRGVTVEALDTGNAVATFNLLNQEGRKVVGAMLPLGSP